MLNSFSTTNFVLVGLILLGTNPVSLLAQKSEVIYDEAQIPKYTLPDPLKLPNGQQVTSPEMWHSQARPAILAQFEEQVYGKAPRAPQESNFKIEEESNDALDGMAIRRQIAIQLSNKEEGPVLHLLLYIPKVADKPVPTFVALNFYGNHTVEADPGILLSESWMRNNKEKGVVDHKATEASRGVSDSRWPVKDILENGYALATAYYGDIDPDYDDGFQNGIHPHFMEEGKSRPDADEWGSIAAWAWGLSRAMDYLEKDADVDGDKVVVMGHSRLGKTALWAGATDTRFAAVISNNSGCGGAALSRRRYGESVKRINTSFPHWFCENFKKYNHNEEACPVDQHMLIALVAPRPVLVCSAEEDRWADPRGEFLSAYHASPVFEMLGVEGLDAREMPAVDQPVFSRVGYYVRPGKHNVLPSDWQRYMKFADRHVRNAN